MKLEQNTSGAWRTVLEFQPADLLSVKLDAARLFARATTPARLRIREGMTVLFHAEHVQGDLVWISRPEAEVC